MSGLSKKIRAGDRKEGGGSRKKGTEKKGAFRKKKLFLEEKRNADH